MASKFEKLETLSKEEFIYMKPSEYKPLVKEAVAEVNLGMEQDGNHAVRITQKGKDFLSSFNEPGEIPLSEKVATVTNKTTFVIKSVPMPTTKRKGGAGRPSKYPFDNLEVGQMFFVPATEDQQDPAKSLGSVVTSANRRYATETGEMKKNRKDEEVPVLEYTRRFVVRPFTETDEHGDNVHGAGVWREK